MAVVGRVALVKTALAPMFAMRNLEVLSWEGVNLLGNNDGRVLAFKVGAAGLMPTNEKRDRTIPPPPALDATPEQVAAGRSLYNDYCLYCHGFSVASSFLVPDLRYMAPERHAAFEEIVLRGTLRGTGMPAFPDVLEPDDLVPLRA